MDSIQTQVVKIYALALFNIAKKQNILDSTLNEINFILEHLLKNKKFFDFLNAPHIPTQDKHQFVDDVLKKYFSLILINLFHVVIEKDRTFLIDDILNYFIKLHDDYHNIRQATIIFSKKHDDELINTIVKKLENYFSCKIKLKSRLDANIGAGFIFVMDDNIIDASLRDFLNELDKKMHSITI